MPEMKKQGSSLQEILNWSGRFNSVSLIVVTSPAILLMSNSRTTFPFFISCFFLGLGGIQTIGSAASHLRQGFRVRGEEALRPPKAFKPRSEVHLAAVLVWLAAASYFFVSPLLPTMANRVRQRDSHYLVEYFREHQADFEAFYAESRHPHLGSSMNGWVTKKIGDGGYQFYKDGRLDIELFQELQGFNGQLDVGYTRIGKDPLDGTLVNDIEKDGGRDSMEYQALGNGWYIYFLST